MALLYATPFLSQSSKQTIWSSLILVFSLLFSTLSESCDSKKQADSPLLSSRLHNDWCSLRCLLPAHLLLLDPLQPHPHPLRLPTLHPEEAFSESKFLDLWGVCFVRFCCSNNEASIPKPLSKAEAATWQTPGQSPLLDSWYFVWSIHDGKKMGRTAFEARFLFKNQKY